MAVENPSFMKNMIPESPKTKELNGFIDYYYKAFKKKSIQKGRRKNAIQKSITLLPPKKDDDDRLTVVLDLDETLIHSEFDSSEDVRQEEKREKVLDDSPDFTFVMNDDGDSEKVKVWKRPHLENFLKKLSEFCEIVVFTASLPYYANPIIDKIDPEKCISHRLFRNSTSSYHGFQNVKSLSRLGRSLNKVLLVDNNAFAMCADPMNGFLIKSFYCDKNDNELEKLLQLAVALKDMKDIKPFLLKKYNFPQELLRLLLSPN